MNPQMAEIVFKEVLVHKGFPDFLLQKSVTLSRISKNLYADLAPVSGRYFSNEYFAEICKMSAQKLSEMSYPLAGVDNLDQCEKEIEKIWLTIVRSFHAENYWGYPVQSQAPVKTLTEEQKITRELTPYIWSLISSTVIMKVIVYYLGLHSAMEEGYEYTLWLVGSLLLSFSMLTSFAWRQHRKEKNKKVNNSENH